MSWGYETEQRIRDVLLELDPKYEEQYSKGYFLRAAPLFYNKLHMRETLAHLDYCGNKSVKVLDFGCGCGQFLLYLWMHGYRNLEGVDANERWLVGARQVFSRLAPGAEVPFRPITRDEIYGINGRYDAITMFGLIYGHKIDVPRAFQATAAALNPGGQYYFNDSKHPQEQVLSWLRGAGLEPLKLVTVSNCGRNAAVTNAFYIAQKKAG